MQALRDFLSGQSASTRDLPQPTRVRQELYSVEMTRLIQIKVMKQAYTQRKVDPVHASRRTRAPSPAGFDVVYEPE